MGDFLDHPRQRPRPDCALRAAHRNLAQGCAFLIARESIAAPRSNAQTTRRRAGNCLRELDRLLCLLLDACAPTAALSPRAAIAFERSHDAAAKLRRLDQPSPTPRLHAIARLRRAASGETPGHPAHHNPRGLALATGERAPCADRLTDRHLAKIAQFYDRLGQDLYIYFATSANLLDFLREEAEREKAIVACDGI
jgi:hypothetical protein